MIKDLEIPKLLILLILLITAIILFLIYGIPTDANEFLIIYILKTRYQKLIALILVGICIGSSSLIFQTLTNNRLLTPSIIGLDSLYVLIQTGLMYLIGAQRVTMLGKIFDQNKKAKTFNKDIAQAVLKLQKTIEKKGKPTALFVMANSGELLTQSPSGRFGWIFSVGGFKAVNENEKLSSHGTPVSYEYIAEKNPNYLFVLDRGATIGQGASSKELFNNDVIKATDAVKNKRVHEVDGKDWYINSGGSRVTLRMIKDVQNFVDNR
ncbi:TPA: iron chelate uptake ABC transporter family permease subunit [Streptococcus agalactiae]